MTGSHIWYEDGRGGTYVYNRHGVHVATIRPAQMNVGYVLSFAVRAEDEGISTLYPASRWHADDVVLSLLNKEGSALDAPGERLAGLGTAVPRREPHGLRKPIVQAGHFLAEDTGDCVFSAKKEGAHESTVRKISADTARIALARLVTYVGDWADSQKRTDEWQHAGFILYQGVFPRCDRMANVDVSIPPADPVLDGNKEDEAEWATRYPMPKSYKEALRVAQQGFDRGYDDGSTGAPFDSDKEADHYSYTSGYQAGRRSRVAQADAS